MAHPSGEKQWQAHDDARTLLSAAEVQADKSRMKAAKKWVKQLKDEAAARVNAAELIEAASPSKKKGT